MFVNIRAQVFLGFVHNYWGTQSGIWSLRNMYNSSAALKIASKKVYVRVIQRWRIASALLVLFSAFPSSARAQVFDEVYMRGTVILNGKTLSYDLRVTYMPDNWRGKPELDRSISDISVRIDGHKLIFPKSAYNDLFSVRTPSGLYTDGLDSSCARFTLEGGGGEKLYEVGFKFSETTLMERDFHYTRPDAGIPDPAIMHFTSEGISR